MARRRTEMGSAALRRALACWVATGLAGTVPAAAQAQDKLPRAQANYLLHCSGCHLPDGSGKPAAGIPDMRATLPLLLATPTGRAFVIQAPGTSGSDLGDAEIAELINWMVPALSRGTPDPAYTSQEVSRYRGAPLDDVTAQRAAALSGSR